MKPVQGEFSYRRTVDRLVRERLDGRSESWEELLQSLRGIDPITAFDSVRRQELLSRIQSDTRPKGGVLERSSGSIAELYFRLPTPHPLDYSWWFVYTSLEALTSKIEKIGGRKVALLGTPTLALYLTRRFGRGRVVLIDKDPLTVQRCHAAGVDAISADLKGGDLPPVLCDVDVADPPWYEEDTTRFIEAARGFLEPSGVLLLTCAPLSTRPGMREEWERVIAQASALGFQLFGEEDHAISYLSPLFEQNAFSAAGVPQTSSGWRHGRLAIFQCVSQMRHSERLSNAEMPAWREFVIGDVRIRVKVKTGGSSARPVLRNVVMGDILPSISRRDPRRDLVDAWTSGNRVFSCDCTSVLIGVLEEVEANVEQGRDQEVVLRGLRNRKYESVGRLIQQIGDLVEIEGREVELWRMRHLLGGVKRLSERSVGF